MPHGTPSGVGGDGDVARPRLSGGKKRKHSTYIHTYFVLGMHVTTRWQGGWMLMTGLEVWRSRGRPGGGAHSSGRLPTWMELLAWSPVVTSVLCMCLMRSELAD